MSSDQCHYRSQGSLEMSYLSPSPTSCIDPLGLKFMSEALESKSGRTMGSAFCSVAAVNVLLYYSM